MSSAVEEKILIRPEFLYFRKALAAYTFRYNAPGSSVGRSARLTPKGLSTFPETYRQQC